MDAEMKKKTLEMQFMKKWKILPDFNAFYSY